MERLQMGAVVCLKESEYSVTVRLICGDAVEQMKTLSSASIDCVITDPPYPEIDRVYGRMTEAEWWEMIMSVCAETRRILKPTGSAVFILQPNSRKAGSMRGWLWEFMAWVCREWNMVQDVWWWNYAALPLGGIRRDIGLMRPSIKACVWAGDLKCYRLQQQVLWSKALLSTIERSSRKRQEASGVLSSPSGRTVDPRKIMSTADERGGVTPHNLVPITSGNGGASSNAGAHGHGAGTPIELAKWWTRYICPPGGTVLDPFVGSGTMMLAAIEYGCNGIGIDKMPEYCEIAQSRIASIL